MTKAMKEAKAKVVAKSAVAATLAKEDARIKSMRATTADVAEGDIKLPAEGEQFTLVTVPWTNERSGRSGEYPAIRLTDSEGQEHDVALSAFRSKDEVVTLDGVTVMCPNLVEFDALPTVTWDALNSVKRLTLHRVVGRRNGRKGRYEYFTFEK